MYLHNNMIIMFDIYFIFLHIYYFSITFLVSFSIVVASSVSRIGDGIFWEFHFKQSGTGR